MGMQDYQTTAVDDTLAIQEAEEARKRKELQQLRIQLLRRRRGDTTSASGDDSAAAIGGSTTLG